MFSKIRIPRAKLKSMSAFAFTHRDPPTHTHTHTHTHTRTQKLRCARVIAVGPWRVRAGLTFITWSADRLGPPHGSTEEDSGQEESGAVEVVEGGGRGRIKSNLIIAHMSGVRAERQAVNSSTFP